MLLVEESSIALKLNFASCFVALCSCACEDLHWTSSLLFIILKAVFFIYPVHPVSLVPLISLIDAYLLKCVRHADTGNCNTEGQSDKFEVHLLLFCRNSMLLPTKLVGWYVGMTWK